MTEILIVGDLHLGRLATMFKTWKQWSFKPLWQAAKYAGKHNIKHIIQCGDVFDEPNPSQELLISLIAFLRKMSKLYPDTIWYFLLGNHDKLDKHKNSLKLMQYLSKRYHLTNYRIFTKPSKISIDTTPVIFLPWPYYNHKLLKSKPALIIAHVERKGSKYDSGRIVTDHDFDLGKHIWWIGHLHQAQEQKNLTFTGSVLQLSFGETTDKYLWHLSINHNKNSIQCSSKKISVNLPYKLQTINVNNLAEHNWQRQFKHLHSDTYIRLRHHSSVIIPAKFANHPQVLRVEPFGSKLLGLISNNHEENLSVKQLHNSEILNLLPVYLSKMGLKKKSIKRAVKIAARHQENLKQYLYQ